MEAIERSTVDVPLRSPADVMRLARLGSFHQCRLSFMRVLLRRLKRERWTFDRPVFEIDAKNPIEGSDRTLYRMRRKYR